LFSYALDQGVISLAAVQAGGMRVMTPSIIQADRAALDAYFRALRGGAEHTVALHIAVSMWFCRRPDVDACLVRKRVSRLLDEHASRGAA
jgi:hypothetical protein